MPGTVSHPFYICLLGSEKRLDQYEQISQHDWRNLSDAYLLLVKGFVSGRNRIGWSNGTSDSSIGVPHCLIISSYGPNSNPWAIRQWLRNPCWFAKSSLWHLGHARLLCSMKSVVKRTISIYVLVRFFTWHIHHQHVFRIEFWLNRRRRI